MHCGPRTPVPIDAADYDAALAQAEDLFARGQHIESIDAFEQILRAHPRQCVPLLSRLYDLYQVMPGRESRYFKYQRRHYDFGIKPGDLVLDIGSGHAPLPMATHLAEYAVWNDAYGRAGTPFQFVQGKPVICCTAEALPFADKSFDFVYCSHILEHVHDPVATCRELSRVAKRGYIESPTRGKDLWLHQAQTSNHTWALSVWNGRLIFEQYDQSDLAGFECDVLMKMAVAPKSDREKAFAAMLFLKANVANTMLLWEGEVQCEVRRKRAPGQ